MTTTTETTIEPMGVELRHPVEALAEGMPSAHLLRSEAIGEEDPRYGIRPHGKLLAVVGYDEHGRSNRWATFRWNRIASVWPLRNKQRRNGWSAGVFWGHYFENIEDAQADYEAR